MAATPVSLALGLLLLAIVVVDLLWTALWVEGGAGPLTSRLMAWMWRALRRVGRDDDRFLSLAGPLVLVTGLTVWLLLLWVGWTLVFATSDAVLVDTVDGGAISWTDRLYFTGYTMFTLGNGDLVPREGVWQLATVLVTASGMLLVTLSVTYVLSVLDAVTQKRAFAGGVSGLGQRGDELVVTAWDGQTFQGLDLQLSAYTTQLNTLTANHKAYPILHYFYSAQTEQAPVTSIAVLDDALTLLKYGVPEDDRPSDAIVENAWSSVEGYLETLHGAFIRPANRLPPDPDIASLRAAGVPTVPDREFEAALDELDDRRRTVLGLVESDARRWPTRDTR
ncbi:potassium channel family protein [Halomarina ordinaria]|uniref:Potassium channel family protein n=1 Tax=Halomarina ordinaria TaxID=3033939 RepID=A0ABD5UK74_9EURY|nr:potassium channel family protein [Halomarina sp. PSRA2]